MQTRLAQKQTGAFYTPLPLAQLLAREILASLPATTHLKNLKILDPAAGEGGLLIPFAKELATRRAQEEPQKNQTEILQDIFSRQLYAADISADALEKIPLPKQHLYHGDALAEKNHKSVLNTLSSNGFDIILANPPYIGQKGHAPLFNKLRANPLWAAYVTPKNDLLYYFFYLTLLLLKPGGIAGFITPPYFATAAGGKQLRRILQQKATFLKLIDFEGQQLFPGVNQYTLLSIFTHGKQAQTPCQMGLTRPSLIAQKNLFYGPDLFLQTKPIVQQPLLTRMANAPYTLGEIAHVSNGLMTGCDKAFILTETQKNALPLTAQELAKLKPFFKNSDISAYIARTAPRLWLIDFFFPNDRHLDMTQYPHLLTHLEQFKASLLARKQNNNGIDKQLAQGKFWFGSVRRKMDFETEKIVLPHRARTVRAAYCNGPWYASSDVYFIEHPKPPYNLWAILGLLNSAPYLTWLQAHGKRKGGLLELYSAPLKQLPIPALSAEELTKLEKLTRKVYEVCKTANSVNEQENLQNQLNTFVLSCF